MRHFIVLGFSSNSQKEPGKQLHLGTDRGVAIEAVNAVDSKYVRKELYELAIPQIRRHKPVEEKKTTVKVKSK